MFDDLDEERRARIRAERRHAKTQRKAEVYADGAYWRDRSDLMYYRYLDFILRTVARDATSIIDVGSASTPYLEWFEWIDERVSFDITPPYQSETVTGIQGDFFTHDFERRFDVATCLQVLEHVPRAGAFLRKLFTISDITVVSVPFEWPATLMDDHVHDPVTRQKLRRWAGRAPNYSIVVEEPFRKPRRLIAVFDNRDPKAGWGKKHVLERVRRSANLPPVIAPQDD